MKQKNLNKILIPALALSTLAAAVGATILAKEDNRKKLSKKAQELMKDAEKVLKEAEIKERKFSDELKVTAESIEKQAEEEYEMFRNKLNKMVNSKENKENVEKLKADIDRELKNVRAETEASLNVIKKSLMETLDALQKSHK